LKAYAANGSFEPILFSNLSTCYPALRAVWRLRLPWFSSSALAHDGVGWVWSGNVETAISWLFDCRYTIAAMFHALPRASSRMGTVM